MAHFDIAVFITQEVYDYGSNNYGDGFRARDRVVTFIEGAFNEASNHSATVTGASEVPKAPREKTKGSLTASCICNPNFTCSWSSLLAWWDDWLINANCMDPHTRADDCNLLITKGSDGGLGGGRNTEPGTAVSSWGQFLVDLPSTYDRFVWSEPGHKMWVVLQEMGHTLLDDQPDKDGDGVGHDSGNVFFDSTTGKYSISPMGVTGDAMIEGYHLNNCEERVDKDDADNDGDGDLKDGRHAQFYNEGCTTKHFTKLQNQ